MGVTRSGENLLSSRYQKARQEFLATRAQKNEQSTTAAQTAIPVVNQVLTIANTQSDAARNGGTSGSATENGRQHNSVSSAYQAAKEQLSDLPVFTESSERTSVGAGRTAQDKPTWLQKSSYFEDGYDFGDVTRTAIATARDFKDNMAAGLLGMGEQALDTLAYIGPAASQMQFIQGGGYYHLPTQAAFDTTHTAAKEAVSDFVAKDLYDEGTLAKRAYENSLARKILPVDIENGSVFGERTDALAQSGGQLLGKVALSPIVPWPVTTAVTSFGGEMENALRQGATYEQAGASAGVTAAWDTLPELLSGGISFGSKTADVPLTRWITDNIPSKGVGTALNFGLDVLGEGTEGVISQFGHNLGSALYRDEKLGEILFGEEARQGYRDSFWGDAILGGFGSAGKLLPGTADLDSKISDLKRQLEAVRQEKALTELMTEYEKHVPRADAIAFSALQENAENGTINTNLLENAKAGNRHAGVYKDALIKTQNHLLKSIRSHEKQVEIHMDKIAHPEKYVPDWGSKTFQERSGLLRKWNKDAQRNSEQAEIEKGTYKERFGDNP